jgi:hypothetical protein
MWKNKCVPSPSTHPWHYLPHNFVFLLGWAMENFNLAFKTSQNYQKENFICVLQSVWYSQEYPQTSLNMNEFI